MVAVTAYCFVANMAITASVNSACCFVATFPVAAALSLLVALFVTASHQLIVAFVGLLSLLIDSVLLGIITLVLMVAVTANSTTANVAITASVSAAYCCTYSMLLLLFLLPLHAVVILWLPARQ